MSERQGSPELRPEPRLVTGVFTCSHPYFSAAALRERRALRVAEQPLFAVRDIEVVPDDLGWRDFTKMLHGLLDEDEAATLDLERMRSVAHVPFETITDMLEPGQIHRLTAEQYAEAYTEKFGDAIVIPTYW